MLSLGLAVELLHGDCNFIVLPIAPAAPLVRDPRLALSGALFLTSNAFLFICLFVPPHGHVFALHHAFQPFVTFVVAFKPAFLDFLPFTAIVSALDWSPSFKFLPGHETNAIFVLFAAREHAVLPFVVTHDAFFVPAFLERNKLATVCNAMCLTNRICLFSSNAHLFVPHPLFTRHPALFHLSITFSLSALAISVVTVSPPALKILNEFVDFPLNFPFDFMPDFIWVAHLLETLLDVACVECLGTDGKDSCSNE